MPTNPTTMKRAPSPGAELRDRAQKLGLWGLVRHWDEVEKSPWIESLLGFEEEERQKRSLERRLQKAKIGRFKPMADFDWSWPVTIERDVIERALTLDFVAEARNLVVVGRNGLGKTMIAQNICHTAVLAGHSVL